MISVAEGLYACDQMLRHDRVLAGITAELEAAAPAVRRDIVTRFITSPA